MAASIFPREIFCPPKEWAEAVWPNLFYWNELDKGGTLPLSNNRSYSPGRCATHSSHGEDDRPRHFESFGYLLRRTGGWCVHDQGNRSTKICERAVPDMI